VLSNKFYTLSKRLTSELAQVSNTYQSLSECSKHLRKVYKLSQCPKFADMYSDLEDCFSNWSDSIKSE